MNDYMLIKDGPSKIPLLADKMGGCPVRIGSKIITLAPCVERGWITLLYQAKRPEEVISWMRNMTKEELTPMQIENAITSFKALHPLSPASAYSFADIPLYAKPDTGLELPIPGYSCTISIEHERELMDMVIAEPNGLVIISIAEWFYNYCNKYALDYDKKCKGEQYSDLAESFLEQHGIYCRDLPEGPIWKGHLIVWGLLSLWEVGSVLLILIGDKIENFFFSLIFLFLGFWGMAAPILYLQNLDRK